jgi:methylphosphotriester-DNA--protein-cysteine methyltransferase
MLSGSLSASHSAFMIQNPLETLDLSESSWEILAGVSASSVANVSKFHLAHLFRQTVGLPPHAYQNQVRLSQARKPLAQGFTASYVANEVFFFDQTHFTNQFKRHVGVTPGT